MASEAPTPPPQPGLLFRRASLEGLPGVVLPPGFEVRPIAPGEEESAGEALSLAFNDEWNGDRVKRDLSQNSFVKTMFVILHEGKVAATASAATGGEWEGLGYVHFVAVHPDWLGKGLGLQVTLACLHEFLRLGFKSAVLHTDDWRLPAIKTYLKLGFVLDQDHHPSYKERWEKISQALDPKP